MCCGGFGAVCLWYDKDLQDVFYIFIHLMFYFRGVSFDSFDIIFPYKYNFAACYEEVGMGDYWLLVQ